MAQPWSSGLPTRSLPRPRGRAGPHDDERALADQHRGVGGAARGGLANLAGAGVAAIAGVGVTWLVARGLGPVPAGSFFAATSAFVLLGSVARLGTSTALVYWPARLRAQERPELIRRCLRAGLIPVAALSAALAFGAWLAAPALFPRYAEPLRVLAIFLPAAALAEALVATTRGYRMIRPTIVLEKLTKPGGQLAGVAALAALSLFAGYPMGSSFWALAWALPYPVVLCCAAVLVWRRVRGEPAGDRLATLNGRSVPRAFWRFAAPRAVASCAQTALQRLDVLMVASMAGLVAAATYAVASRFLVVGQLANGAISQAVQPRLAESLTLADRRRSIRLYQSSTAWLVLISWPLNLLVLQHAEWYLRLFGASYVAAAPAVWVLALAMLVASGCGMVDVVLAMAGRTTLNLVNVLIALTTMIGINLYTIPVWGALGAAFGLAAAVLVNNLLPLSQVWWSLRLHPFGAATRTAMLLTLLCFGLLPFLAGLLPWTGTPHWTIDLASTAISSFIYLLAVYYLRARLGVVLSRAVRRQQH